MFCKYCGDRIDKTGQCIRCGKPAGPGPLEGGVGFWDLAGKGGTGGANHSINPPATSINTAKVEKLISEGTERLDKGLNHIYRRQAQVNRSQTVILTVIVLLLAVSVFLDIWLLWTVCDIQDVISELTNEETTTATESNETFVPTIPTNPSMSEEEIAPTGALMPEEETVPEEEPLAEIVSGEIVISKPPSSVVLSGIKTGRAALFTIEAWGNNLSFEWQKLGADGKWVAIDDEDLFLEVETSLVEGEGESILYQRAFDDSLFGKYRCIVRDSVTGSEAESSEVEVKRSENQGGIYFGDIP